MFSEGGDSVRCEKMETTDVASVDWPPKWGGLGWDAVLGLDDTGFIECAGGLVSWPNTMRMTYDAERAAMGRVRRRRMGALEG